MCHTGIARRTAGDDYYNGMVVGLPLIENHSSTSSLLKVTSYQLVRILSHTASIGLTGNAIDTTVMPNVWAMSRTPGSKYPLEEFHPERFLDPGEKNIDPRSYAFGFGSR